MRDLGKFIPNREQQGYTWTNHAQPNHQFLASAPQNTSSETGELEEMFLIFTPGRPSTFRDLVLTVQEGITMDDYGYGHYWSGKTEDSPTVTNPASPASMLCLLCSQGKVLFLHHAHSEPKRRGRVLVSEKSVPCGYALDFWKLPTKISSLP